MMKMKMNMVMMMTMMMMMMMMTMNRAAGTEAAAVESLLMLRTKNSPARRTQIACAHSQQAGGQ